MQFKVNDGKVPYIMVAGSDYVSGKCPWKRQRAFMPPVSRNPATSSRVIPSAWITNTSLLVSPRPRPASGKSLAKADFYSLYFRYHLPVGKPFHEAYG